MGKKIPILFVMHVLRNYGGTEKYIHELVKRLDRKKFKLHIIYMEGNELNIGGEIKEVLPRIIQIPFGNLFSFNTMVNAIKTNRYIKKEKIKIIQTFNAKANILIPIIVNIGGIKQVISSRRDMGLAMTKRHFFLQRISNLFTATILANSNGVKKYCIKNEHLSNNKINVIYNGVDLDHFSDIEKPEKKILKNKFGISDSTFIVGSVSNFREVKGNKFFIQAFPMILRKVGDTKFILVGDGPELKEAKRIVFRLGLTHKVIFTGCITEIKEILSIMDVLVHSSLSEGFSNTILEAMAMCKPVVVTNVGGNPEAVVNGFNGYLVPPGNSSAIANAVIRILKDRGLAQRLGISARKRVEKFFTMDKMIAEMECLYDSLINKNS